MLVFLKKVFVQIFTLFVIGVNMMPTIAMEKVETPDTILRQVLTLKFTDQTYLYEEVQKIQPLLNTVKKTDYLAFIERHQKNSLEEVDVRLWLPKAKLDSLTQDELQRSFLAATYFPWQLEEKTQTNIRIIMSRADWLSYEFLRKNLCLSLFYGYPPAYKYLLEEVSFYAKRSKLAGAKELLKFLKIKKPASGFVSIPLSFNIYTEEFANANGPACAIKNPGIAYEDTTQQETEIYLQYLQHMIETGNDQTDLKLDYFM